MTWWCSSTDSAGFKMQQCREDRETEKKKEQQSRILDFKTDPPQAKPLRMYKTFKPKNNLRPWSHEALT